MVDYKIGDVVNGRFSAHPASVTTAIVRGRPATGQWNGDLLGYDPDHGPETWGYDTEIDTAREATEEDEQQAQAVKRRHAPPVERPSTASRERK